jgi:hypothetical protein
MNNYDPLIIALNDFSLDKEMFNKMSKKDLQVFINTILTSSDDELQVSNSKKHLIVSANYLLNLKIKSVKFEADTIYTNKKVKQSVKRSNKKINYNSFDLDYPIGASVDILFDSLINKKMTNSII